jgi:predicted NBD/HSP70 family sugar kinase
MKKIPSATVIHGTAELSRVLVKTYSVELRDAEGFVGDRASNRAFRAIVDDLRDHLKKVGDDPFGETPTSDLSKKKLDKVLGEGDPEAAGIVHGAVEQFATEFASVIARFLKLKGWRDVQRIAVGGGLRASRIGEIAIGRTSVMLKATGHKIDLVPIGSHPDEAGLIGAAFLAPGWMFHGYQGILAVDIGGSNVRAGVVDLHLKKNKDLSHCTVHESEIWRYADDDDKPKRDQAVERIGHMLSKLTEKTKSKLKLAPFIGIACPGIIGEDGHIESGGQNLPGNWQSRRFNLPSTIRQMIPRIGDHDTMVVMHNDAVVQGLSEIPNMSDMEHWGVLTIGTGLGNASFSNRPALADSE